MQSNGSGCSVASNSLREALHSTATVRGTTHAFYRYPARFSPDFARSFIQRFTNNGDVVLDCFMGGGTSAVEALSGGRRFVGCDVNSLAFFLTSVKTTSLSQNDQSSLVEWKSRLATFINLRTGELPDDERASRIPWNIRKTLGLAMSTLASLPNPRTHNFARCSLLRTAQWAIDCRRETPTKDDFLSKHGFHFSEMLRGAEEFASTYDRRIGTTNEPAKRLFNCAAADLADKPSLAQVKARLLITSPPYPGVHVLYHRWQLQGRRETPAAYWVANCMDGQAPSFYTFGPRQPETWKPYMSGITASFASAKKLLHPEALVVQLIAFSNPDVQYPLYLAAMRDAGYDRTELAELGEIENPIIRSVPNRKWYAQSKGAISASREYVLVHRPR